MDQFFTLGDLLVLIAGIAIILAFRQIDRNNRSLERVKRFTDQAIEQLGKSVEERSRELKDISIEVEVHQKAFRSVIEHVEQSLESLNSRSQEIDVVARGIDEYKKVITELLASTGDANTNLQRVKDESKFIDGVGRRIKEVHQQLSTLEKSIPSISENFSKINEQQNRDAARKLLEEVSGIADSNMAAVQAAGDEATANLRRIEAEIGAFQDEQQKFASGLEELLRAREAEYRNAIAAAVEDARDLKADLVKSIFGSFEEVAEQKREELEARLSRIDDEFKAGLVSLSSAQNSSIEDFRAWKQQVESDQEEFTRELRQNFETGVYDIRKELQSALEEVDNYRQSVDQKFKENEALWTGKLDEFENTVSARREEFRTLLYQSEEKLRSELEKVREQGNAMADAALMRMNQDIEAKSDSIRTSIEQNLEDLTERTQATHGQIDRDFSSLQSRLNTYIDESKEFITTIEQRMAEIQSRVAQDHIEYETKLNDHIESSRERIQIEEDRISDQIRNLSEQLAKIRQDSDATILNLQHDLDTRVGALQAEVLGQIQRTADDGMSALEELKRRWDERSAALSSRQQTVSDEFAALLEQEQAAMERAFAEIRDRQDQAAQSVVTDIRGDLENFKVQLLQNAEVQRAEFGKRLDVVDADIRSHIQQAGQELSRLQSLQQDLDARTSELVAEIGEKIGSTTAYLDSETRRVHTDLQAKVQALEYKMMKQFEDRLLEYEQAFIYRVQDIEKVSDDIAQVEVRLRDSLGQVEAEIVNRAKSHADGIRQEEEAFRAAMAAKVQSVQDQMTDLEGRLDELKKRAYDNVSERLQVFEDEFFAELTGKSNQLENQVNDWRANVTANLQTIANEMESRRRDIEVAYVEGLQEKIQALQTQSAELLARLDSQVSAQQRAIELRITSQDSTINSHEIEIRESMRVLQESVQQKLGEQYKLLQNASAERIAGIEIDFDNRIRRLEATVEDKTSEIVSLNETVKADISRWQAGFLQQMQAASASLSSELDQANRRIQDQLVRVEETAKRDFESLGDEILANREKVIDAVEVAEKSVAANLAKLNEQSARILDDFSQASEESRTEVETNIREFRETVSELRADYENQQKRMLQALEARASQLAESVEDIEKRQKAFIVQTKIFERADQLKLELTADIERLKGEIDRLRNEKKDFDSIEALVTRIQAISNDANGKIDRIVSEKKRIDAMEESLDRLLAAMQSVDVKIQQAQEQQDQLIELQKNLRELGDLEKAVETKFERLEKKSGILETTIEGVDKNFQQLNDIEKRFAAIQRNLAEDVPDRIAKIENQITQISLKKTEADLAMRHMGELDGLIKDVEARIKQVQSNREWLARTETRFEEITRLAAEQVEVLGSLVKDEVARTKQDPAQVPANKRDLVIRLAHQGWKIEEIAKTTKLSRGEIELILEMKKS